MNHLISKLLVPFEQNSAVLARCHGLVDVLHCGVPVEQRETKNQSDKQRGRDTDTNDAPDKETNTTDATTRKKPIATTTTTTTANRRTSPLCSCRRWFCQHRQQEVQPVQKRRPPPRVSVCARGTA